MTKCNNCGYQVRQLMRLSSCRTPNCRNQISSTDDCTANSYCPTCQNRLADLEGPQIVSEILINCANPACRDRILIPEDLTQKRYGFLCSVHSNAPIITSSPTPLETELKKDHQQITTALKLKDKELADRQGQIRALETKLNEKENNSP